MATMSQTEYAAHIKRSQQYVSKLVKEGKIPCGSDGRIEPLAADAARERNTRTYLGEVRRLKAQRRTLASFEPKIDFCPVCEQRHRVIPQAKCKTCGGDYPPYYVARNGVPEPLSYCSRKCAGVPEPKPQRFTCQQCGDPRPHTIEEGEMCESPDATRFCCDDCAYDASANKTRAQTRRRVALHLLADGWTRKQLKEEGYGDWL
jgi:hypothetical protein